VAAHQGGGRGGGLVAGAHRLDALALLGALLRRREALLKPKEPLLERLLANTRAQNTSKS
jgi:hypothetical protein